MPELPDVTLYVEALQSRVIGHILQRVLVRGPFLLRSTHPPLDAAFGKTVGEVRRIGKRIALGVDGEIWLAIHLMIAGRLRWKPSPVKLTKGVLAAFEFDTGTLVLTEAGTQHRASLTLVEGEAGLRALDPGGIEPLKAGFEEFDAILRSANHTLKRALTDPRLISGIGNAYSDEILHRACLSPVLMTRSLTPAQSTQLYDATREVLLEWTDRLRTQLGAAFPEKVTAFHEEMAVHGRYGLPCPRCGSKVQRIRYAKNETNYCATCQTGGRLMADRGLSRLLRKDWPHSLDELEALKRR